MAGLNRFSSGPPPSNPAIKSHPCLIKANACVITSSVVVILSYWFNITKYIKDKFQFFNADAILYREVLKLRTLALAGIKNLKNSRQSEENKQ
jgi:hypothetical protein